MQKPKVKQKMNQHKWIVALSVGVLVVCFLGAGPAHAGYTVAITDLDFEFDKNSSTGIVTISGSYKWQLNNNYTTLKLYHYALESGKSEKLTTKTTDFSNYINGTNGTSGLVSQTFTMTFDPPAGLERDETIVVWAKIYNATLEVDHLITSKSHGEDYPYAGVAATTATTSAKPWYQDPTKVAIAAFAVGVTAVIALALIIKIFFAPKRQVP